MGSEPKVDAAVVVDVVADGNQAEGFVVFELVKAHGAGECAFADLEAFHVRVEEGGECVDDFLVEAIGELV